MMRNLPVKGLIALALVSGLLAGCDKAEVATYPTLDRLTPGIFLEPDERAVLPPGVELRPVYDKGISLTKESEGFVGDLYNDAAGYCTIAYGHLIKLARCNGSEPVEFRGGVSEPRGVELLREDMGTAKRVVLTAVNVDLTDGQYAALCDFVFNVGGGNFRKSTLLKVINAGAFQEVAFQMRRWIKAGGRELSGLVTRREREIELFFEGIGIPRAAPPVDMDLSPLDVRTGEK
jgi:GH24 family phage-related lysozyme (muramidase)